MMNKLLNGLSLHVKCTSAERVTMEIVFPFLICKISHEDFKIGIVKNDLFNSDSF